MKSIVSNKSDDVFFKEGLHSKRNKTKYQKFDDYDEDMVVVSRDDFDATFDSYDWIVNEKFSKKVESFDEEINGYRQLARYEDILKIINEDKIHVANLNNFEKNNDKFYNSMKDEIFNETLRIIGDPNYSIKNRRNSLNSNDNNYNELESKYRTLNNDVDKIISITSSRDKGLLNLINNDDERNDLDGNLSDFYKTSNSKIDNDETLSNLYKESKIQPNPDLSVEKAITKIAEESIAKQDKNNTLEKPPVVPNTSDIKSNVVLNVPSSKPNDIEKQKDTSPIAQKNDYIYESQIIKKSDQSIPQEKLNKETTKPVASELDSNDEQKQLTTKPLSPIGDVSKTKPSPIIQPYAPVKPKVFDIPNKSKQYKEQNILPPSSSVEDTEYNKLKRMIEHYKKNSSDLIAAGSSDINIGIADSLKVNLHKNFYLNSDELFDGRRAQDEKMDKILTEYEKTLEDNKNYEVNKEINKFKKDLFSISNTNNESISNKVNELSKINQENVRIRNENNELKNKIKELEQKMRNNIDNQKQVIKEKEELKKSIEQKREKNLGLKQAIVDQLNSAIDSKPMQQNITKMVPTSENDIDKSISKDDGKERHKNLIVKQNTLENLNKVNENKIPIKKIDQTTTSSNQDLKNKPFTFKEVGQNQIDKYSNDKTLSQRIFDDSDVKITKLENAYNTRKAQLFQSFNPEQIDNTIKHSPNNAKFASQRILGNKLNDSDNYKVVSLKDAMNHKKRN